MQREFTTAAAVDSNTTLHTSLQPPTSRSVSQAVCNSHPPSRSLSPVYFIRCANEKEAFDCRLRRVKGGGAHSIFCSDGSENCKGTGAIIECSVPMRLSTCLLLLRSVCVCVYVCCPALITTHSPSSERRPAGGGMLHGRVCLTTSRVYWRAVIKGWKWSGAGIKNWK